MGWFSSCNEKYLHYRNDRLRSIQMKGFAFELKGNAAFFKKPDVNVQIYFTYGHIHRVALLGMFGAILGYGGYHQQNRHIELHGNTEENQYPEFYDKLKKLPICIVPRGDRGYFTKKIQVFNNSVGYASGEVGRNLIIREQWLEKPHWTIYILDDGSVEFNKLNAAISQRCFQYLPYLGKNDHPAIIENYRELTFKTLDSVTHIDSLFQAEAVPLTKGFIGLNNRYYREALPFALDVQLNGYVFEEMMYTNRKIDPTEKVSNVFLAEEKNLYFC